MSNIWNNPLFVYPFTGSFQPAVVFHSFVIAYVDSEEASYINIVNGLPSSIPNALSTFPKIVIADGGIESSQTTKPAQV